MLKWLKQIKKPDFMENGELIDQELVRLLINYIDRKIEYELAVGKLEGERYMVSIDNSIVMKANLAITDYLNSVNDKE